MAFWSSMQSRVGVWDDYASWPCKWVERKCKKNGKGLVLFGPCWPNLGLNSDLNGAQKKAGIELGLKEEGLGEMGRGCLQLHF